MIYWVLLVFALYSLIVDISLYILVFLNFKIFTPPNLRVSDNNRYIITVLIILTLAYNLCYVSSITSFGKDAFTLLSFINVTEFYF